METGTYDIPLRVMGEGFVGAVGGAVGIGGALEEGLLVVPAVLVPVFWVVVAIFALAACPPPLADQGGFPVAAR